MLYKNGNVNKLLLLLGREGRTSVSGPMRRGWSGGSVLSGGEKRMKVKAGVGTFR